MSKLGLELLSLFLLLLLNGSNGLPAKVNDHRSLETSAESRNIPSTLDSGFVPIIPSQIDPHPILSSNSETNLNPIFAEQNFFPLFFRSNQQQMNLARPFSNRYLSSTSSSLSSSRFTPSSSTKAPFDESILGSGDFAVLRGGTFYGEGEKKRRPNYDYFGSGSSFYESSHSNSGRPFTLPLESPHYSDDPFANFKDFADITAGIDSDFSHFVVVYANKNSTNTKHEPKNILEQLQIIDDEKRNEQLENEATEVTTVEPIKISKLSKFKTKLKLTKAPRKKKKETPKKSLDYVDPLIADS